MLEPTARNPPENESLPLWESNDGILVQPGRSTVVQHTTVTIPTEPPKDHIIWSLCCFIYTYPCCCLGLAALIFSVKARDRKVVGDLDGARHYGSTARCINICATALISAIFLIAIIVTIVVVVKTNEAYSSYRHNWNSGDLYHRVPNYKYG